MKTHFNKCSYFSPFSLNDEFDTFYVNFRYINNPVDVHVGAYVMVILIHLKHFCVN